MSDKDCGEIADLMKRYAGVDGDALEDVLPLVYEELRALAGRQLASQRRDHTLQATALINEAYLRLADQQYHSWENRRQFVLVAATVMRRVLVDYARRRAAAKRPQEQLRVEIEANELGDLFEPDLMVLDQILEQLAEIDERQAKIVELRYFAGLSINETAEALEISDRTVTREWRMALAWLKRKLS